MKPDEVALTDPAGSGLHEIPASALEPVCVAAVAAGLFCARLDLGACRDKAALLAALAAALRFPDWFGANWDALADCLDDLQWLPGRGVVLALERADALQSAAPDTYRIARELLAEAAASWRQRERPLHVLLVESPAQDAHRTPAPDPNSRQDSA